MEEEIKRRNLAGRVLLIGYQPELAELMKTADLFVLPSYREGTPRVISEAMAAGLPVVATRIDGIPEQVEHLICDLGGVRDVLLAKVGKRAVSN